MHIALVTSVISGSGRTGSVRIDRLILGRILVAGLEIVPEAVSKTGI
ncbi:MAG: hypothetical protein [Olavius algarvensis Delta 4 endosymbiont]|nr:MAG: hypothetical protein [Olavius algarvensis Delta 4 endosymbiont]